MNDSQVITVPNLILKKPTNKVTVFNDELKKQVELMKKELLKADGVGLAANQIGYDNSVFVVEFSDPEEKNSIPFQVFINPKIIEESLEKENLEEGCLSVPKIELPVTRSTKIKVQAQNLEGKKIKITAKNLLAKVMLHENDHLNGIVFTERIKEELIKKYPNYKEKKIIFIGTGDFAELILRGLILTDFNIASIITESPKPAGRGGTTCDTTVAQTAKTFEKNLLETDNIKDLTDEIKKQDPDLILLTDFGQIIPPEVLEIPKIAALNIHPSLLPKYRGATPIPSAILFGEKNTGISIIQMVDQIDKGPVVTQKELEIEEFDNNETLRKRLANLALKTLLEFLPEIESGNLKPIIQDEKLATKTRKFSKEDGEIDWQKSPEELDRQIRAFHPWPGSYTFIDNKRLIIHSAFLDEGKLYLDIVQPEGKKPMEFGNFLRGYRGPLPEWFSKIGNIEK